MRNFRGATGCTKGWGLRTLGWCHFQVDVQNVTQSKCLRNDSSDHLSPVCPTSGWSNYVPSQVGQNVVRRSPDWPVHSLVSSSFFPLFPPSRPLSPSHPFRSVFVSSLCYPASVVALLCFCFVASSALRCLLFCVPGSGSCVLLLPPLPPFSFFVLPALLCAPSACNLLSAFVVFPLVSALFAVAGCPCSLPLPPPSLCCVYVCVPACMT